jgi:hypothetical protein
MMTAKEMREAQAAKKAELLERTLRMIEEDLQRACKANDFPAYIEVDVNRDIATSIRTTLEEKGFLVGQRSDLSEGEIKVTLTIGWRKNI